MAMLSFARGNPVDLDIFIYDQEGGTLTDPDGYAGGTEPTLKIYDQDGDLVHDETDPTNIARTSAGRFRFTGYTIPTGADVGQNWRIVWYFRINGNLLPVSSRTEYFEVRVAGAAAMTAPYNDNDDTAAMVEGLNASDIKDAWRDWANWIINMECGKDFYSHDVTEYHDISEDQAVILLEHYPIITVTTVQDNVNGLGNANPTTITSAHYNIQMDCGILTLISDTYSVYTKGIQNVSVAYTYGWLNVPSEVATMANMLIAWRGQVWLLEKDDKAPFGAQMIQIGDFTQTFGQTFGPVGEKFAGRVSDINNQMMLLKRLLGKKVI